MEKKKSLPMDVLYFLLTVLFFYTQLHLAIQFAWNQSISLLTLVLALLCLKSGEALHEFFDGGRLWIWTLLAASSSAVIVLWPELVPFFFLFGLSMMKVRSTVARYSNKKVKVAARTVGFLVAPLSSVKIYLIYIGVLFASCLLYQKLSRQKQQFQCYFPKIRSNFSVYWTMGLHHAHYFAYAYTIPYLFAANTDVPYWLVGLIFYIGWAAYNAYEWFLKPAWNYFILGHILALGALIGLYYSSGVFGISFWWFITGLGGGTVYMLHSFLKEKGVRASREILIAEGFGHVSGILIWGLTSLFMSLEFTIMMAAIFALITTIVSVWIKSHNTGQETSIQKSL